MGVSGLGCHRMPCRSFLRLKKCRSPSPQGTRELGVYESGLKVVIVNFNMCPPKMVLGILILEMRLMLRFYSRLWACHLKGISSGLLGFPDAQTLTINSQAFFSLPSTSLSITWCREWLRRILAMEHRLKFS